MVYMSQLRMGDKFTVNGSDAVFKFSHKSGMCSDSYTKCLYHATLEGVHCMFNDILVNRVETPKESKQIPIIYSVEDIIEGNGYTTVMRRNGFDFLGLRVKSGMTYKCIETGKLYTAPTSPNYEEAHTIWLTEYVE